MAPEIFKKNVKEFCKCDIWSCGVLLHILLIGKPPIEGNNDQITEFLKATTQIEFKDEDWTYITDDGRDLCEKLLKVNQDERLESNEILNLSWFGKFHAINKAVAMNPQPKEVM